MLTLGLILLSVAPQRASTAHLHHQPRGVVLMTRVEEDVKLDNVAVAAHLLQTCNFARNVAAPRSFFRQDFHDACGLR
jgi:hypothetical protein